MQNKNLPWGEYGYFGAFFAVTAHLFCTSLDGTRNSNFLTKVPTDLKEVLRVL